MAVYVVNNFFTTPYLCVDSNGKPATVDEVGRWFRSHLFPIPDSTLYFEHDVAGDPPKLLEEYLLEEINFVNWFKSGVTDVRLLDAGYDDCRIYPGYEEGCTLAFNDIAMPQMKVHQTAEQLFYANKMAEND